MRYFVKLNDASKVAMFEAEAKGLREIVATRTVRAPQPVCCGVAEGRAYLVLEYIEMIGDHALRSQELFGQQLAQMHSITASRYGWHIDNTLGSTPQINAWCSDWVTFWREQRLGFQLALAAQQGYTGALQRRGEKLLSDIPVFFQGYTAAPALLHGDLWPGNYGVDTTGKPVIFDPAPYYGDREADIAMTELFGGFSSVFYSAYDDAYPLDADFKTRKILYNLYHILNHLNLFGDSYLCQAERMMDQLLSEVR